MPGVSKEQIAEAKKMDLLTYLQTYEPYSIKQCGVNAYQLVEHDSLKISNGKWNWFSRGIGGKTALDFLVKVRGLDFVSAVETLVDGHVDHAYFQPVKTTALPAEKKKDKAVFILPEKHWDNFRAIAYLQNRGIDREIIDRCISEGTVYESKKFHNCVFVGRDKENNPRYACLRGTSGRFIQEIEGSDKQFSFTTPTREPPSHSLLVFESPIDALSQATMDKNSNIGSSWDCFQRISLSSVSPLALIQYLKDHQEIDCISLCLDNDEAGHRAAQKIKVALNEMPHPLHGGKYIVSISPPAIGKDYNEMLQMLITEKSAMKKISKNEPSL